MKLKIDHEADALYLILDESEVVDPINYNIKSCTERRRYRVRCAA
jgi:uncharacterized protein YuzE